MSSHSDDATGSWDDAPCGLFVVAADGIFVKVNTTFCRWVGYERTELIGVKKFQALLSVGARIFLQTHWTPLLQLQASISEVQLDFVRRDGVRLPMMLNAVRRNDGGAIRDEVAALIASDRKLYERELLAARADAETAATDLKVAHGRLRALNEELSNEHRRKDIFLATLAHELRNPLAPIANVVEVLARADNDRDLRQWAVGILSRQVAQMSHLVDDLLDVSRITQGKVELRFAELDLAAILRQAADEVLPAMRAQQQSLTAEIPDAAIVLRADQTRLTQVVANLLNNASKYSPAGAHVTLRVWQADDKACFEVADDGVGIPPDQLSSIFHMFSQLTPVLERSVGGLGIGLALVKSLVTLHGGTVDAHSAGLGQGSRFVVRLPGATTGTRRASGPLASTPALAVGTRHANLKIVVVDDNADAADTLAMALELLDYDARTANSATEGMRLIQEFAPDVALLDIGLPDFNGYDMARRLRLLPESAKLILIAATGWGQESDKRTALEAGFDSHFTKPIDFHQLNQAIAQLARRTA